MGSNGLKGARSPYFQRAVVDSVKSGIRRYPSIENPGTTRGNGRVGDSSKRPGHVGGRHAATLSAGECVVILEAYIGTQVKRIAQAVSAYIPARGERWYYV